MLASGPARLGEPPGRLATAGQTRPVGSSVEHMFVSLADQQGGTAPDEEPSRGSSKERAREPLGLLAERSRPVSSSQTRLLPVVPPLAGLLPDGALRRGSTIVVTGLAGGGPNGSAGGDIALALALAAAASGTGSWCAFVGMAGLGAVAAHDLGIDLARSAVIPRPGAAWAEVTAALIDGVDLVMLCPPFPPRPAMARRLVTRVRQHRSVLVVVGGRAGWPEPPDMHLGVSEMRWDGVGTGEGYLHRRRMTVTATGRRAATRPRHHHLWLPSTTGSVEDAVGSGSAH